jgi:O-antigen/teichoic acid export membrane protein
MADSTPHSNYHRELLWNQIWQGLNFGAKFGLFFLLTPLMLRTWGKVQFGLFALASSLLVSLAVLDFGVRSSTRLRLCEALAAGDEPQFVLYLRRGFQAFGVICLAAVVVALGLGLGGAWGKVLHLPEGGDRVMTTTIFLVAFFMMSSLLLEPIAARGRISDVKKANTAGAALAIPFLWLWVRQGGGVMGAVLVYFAFLILANAWLLGASGLPWRRWIGPLFVPCPSGEIGETLRHGGWFYATTLALVAKSHLLTFLVSSVAGPAAAGTFYILLRFSESAGVLGATASDTNLASLATAPDAAERAKRFGHSYLYAALFCLHAAVFLAILAETFLHLWLPEETGIPLGIGAALAVFGLGGAFSRIVVNSAMGVGEIKVAALGNLVEASLILLSAPLLLKWEGLRALFAFGGLASLALLPAARRLALKTGRMMGQLYLRPLVVLLPGLAASTACCLLGLWIGRYAGLAVAGAGGAAIVLYEWRRLHRQPAE